MRRRGCQRRPALRPRLAVARGLALVGSLLFASVASSEINATPPPVGSPVEITAHGILWDGGHGLDLVGRNGKTTLVSAAAGLGAGRGDFAVVTTAQAGLAISQLGAPPRPLGVGPRVGPGGCRDWVADPSGRTSETGVSFTVSGEELVLAGSPACRPTPPTSPRPLFALPLAPGGRWRVLRWLPNSTQPLLSARGGWLGVGIPRPDGTMLAEVVDARTGRVRNALDLPDAYLAVEESGALVAAVGDITQDVYAPPIEQPYKLLYVAPGGRHARRLLTSVTVYGVPSVSDGRVAYELGDADLTRSLAVTNLRTGATRLVAGFRSSQRELLDFDLSGNELAWTQSDVQPPPPNLPPIVPCMLNQFFPPVVLTLHSVDLSTPGAFIAPPPPAAPGSQPVVPPCNEQ